jgi:hypothetical protein
MAAKGPIVDDTTAIGIRLRQIVTEEGRAGAAPAAPAKKYNCQRCFDGGWLSDPGTRTGWRECPSCDKWRVNPRPR